MQRALALGLAALLVGAVAPLQAQPVSAQDDAGTAVHLPAPARRIITLAPHATELVFAAGGGDRIVGTIRYSDYPPAARTIPRVGDAQQLDGETIIALRPDLLVAWLAQGVRPVQALIDTLGVPVFHSQPQRLADIPVAIEQLGRLLDTRPIADPAAAALRARLTALAARVPADAPPVRVFVQAGSDPLFSLNDTHIVSDAIRLCGGINVFGTAPVPAPQIGMESLLLSDPQLIVTAAAPGQSDAQVRAQWQPYASALPAVRNGQVLVLDADALYRPGPRLLDAAEALCAAIADIRKTENP